jgi:class 3 adenylate cyclase/HEAT repeat protein
MAHASTETPRTSPASETGAPRLEIEPLLTTHRILEAFDGKKKGLEWLHGDLFDSRLPVALSALEAVGAIGDARSFPHLSRLLSSAPEPVQCGAARAMGMLRLPAGVALLIRILKTTRSEKLRREILGALANAAPQDKDVLGILHQVARAPMASASARAHAAGLLLQIGGERALEELLSDSREEILFQVLLSASESAAKSTEYGGAKSTEYGGAKSTEYGGALVPRIVAHCAPLFANLPIPDRALLAGLAARQALPESASVISHALADAHVEVRRAAYACIGTEPHHAALIPDIVDRLTGSVEETPSIEDEVQQALARLAKLGAAPEGIPYAVRARVISRISDLYKQLSAEGRHVSSDTHELGWLIMRSKEYLEYYGDEDFKAALLRWFKGASQDTPDDMLRMLKATAARVEVRHFDGYSALADLIKNPHRTGIALVGRELALVKTGKSRVFWHLIRVLRLSALFLVPHGAEAALIRTIYGWSKQEKLFRLSEAALSALARVDAAHALSACKECLALPLVSKVLAIASLHVLRGLSPEQLEPSAIQLLANLDDPYITLNAIEAISVDPPSSSGELAKALLARLSLSTSSEVRDSVARYLGEKMSLDIMESLKEPALNGDAPLRASALSVMHRRIIGGLVTNRDNAVEFLYRVLRGDHEPSRRAAALMLWKLGDDYASEVLRDFLSSGAEEATIEILRGLQGALREPLPAALAPLLSRGSAPLQAALRELLLHAEDEGMREKALALALQVRGGSPDEGGDLPLADVTAPTVELRTERSSFQFERENIQELVMFFSDIKGYSKKAEVLTHMQLSTLIQDYEKILLAHVEAHRGELVKRMGDGHMMVFQRPLDAVLAAIRLQKSLLRFNRYRDESSRVEIRIGIHSGKVVRKAQGDVLGNAVNIAARLESSARPGFVLISEQVQESVKDAVHSREIGHITVKNISEPIRVFEPYEIALDLPPELDPLKKAQISSPAPAAADRELATAASSTAARAGSAAAAVTLDRETYKEIIACFSALADVCRKASGGQIAVSALSGQVLARWGRIKPRLPGITRKEPRP